MAGIFDNPEMQQSPPQGDNAVQRPNPFVASDTQDKNPFSAPDMREARKEPSTTAGGLATAAARGLGPQALGAGIGAAIGAPLGGIGAPFGAAAGASSVAAADLALNVANIVARSYGLPEFATAQDAADWIIDVLGGKPKNEMSPLERTVQSTVGGAASATGMSRAAMEFASRLAPNTFGARVAGRMAERPVAQSVAGGVSGAAGQTAVEAGLDPTLASLIGIATGGALPGAAEHFGTRPTRAIANTLGIPLPQMPREKMLAARPEDQARSIVSEAYLLGAEGGAPNARDMVSKMRSARESGQTLTLSDMENVELRGLAKQVKGQGGAASQEMENFFKDRSEGARERLEKFVRDNLASEETIEARDNAANSRSTSGRALWALARRGEGLDPIDHQYRSAFVKAGNQIQQINEQMIALNGQIAEAVRREASGNVADAYFNQDAPNSAILKDQLENLAEQRQQLMDDRVMAERRLRKHGVDPNMAGPGSAWTPALERALQTPEVKAAWRKAIGIQRRDSFKPESKGGTPGSKGYFNATDYAMDDAGNLRRVPDMKTWIQIKTSLDEIIDAKFNNDMKNRVDGRLSADTISYMNIRDGIVQELDDVNKYYKPARRQWAEHSDNMRALAQGENALNHRNMSREAFERYYNGLGPREKEYYDIGIANDLIGKIRAGSDTTDPSKVFTPEVRARLAIIAGDENKANILIDLARTEAEMAGTDRAIGRAPLRRRPGEHGALGRALNAGAEFVWSAIHLFHGSPAAAGARALRGGRYLIPSSEDLRVNDAIGRILIDPTIDDLMAQGSAYRGGPILLPQIKTPPTAARSTLPGSVLGGAAVIPVPQNQQ